jgi:AraC family transcriptional regulator of adaptative response/methylated-DNA-[protein]-cysteine methyltransferase
LSFCFDRKIRVVRKTAAEYNVTMTVDARWHSVAARDRQADGQFVYAVTTTGIYCRPSCASRRPHPSRVRFFPDSRAAQLAGFRACKRCRPDASSAGDPWPDKIRRACACLANVDGHLSLERLARQVGGSPYHLQRQFKRLVGVSPREFAEARRLRKAKERLRHGADATTAAFDAGYGSASRFYERLAKTLGMRPGAYKKGGAGMRIRYTIVDSPFGKLMVAATPQGVCSVAMSASAAHLERALAAEYPAASIEPEDGTLHTWTEQVLAHLSGRLPRIDLPLDVRATAFQWQVWTALAAIPRGETRSYAEVARAIGRPQAARAVARACAANPVALAIPCHRVVPTAGGVGGYRWGSERKQALLAAEQRGS